MLVLNVRNVHEALPIALRELYEVGVRQNTRNGAVLKFPTPVTTVYAKPLERVIFYPQRDANPFFHFFESLWMLSGRNDVEYPAKYVKTIANYSDNGKTFHAAYGHRWRQHFLRHTREGVYPIDQLSIIIKLLRENPDNRQVVLTMWDPSADLAQKGKDFPCNMQAIFSINEEGKLDMLVTNRSNDIVWGCYGANAVHFSYLMEFIAAGVGVPVGTYYQMSYNLHLYDATSEQVEGIQIPEVNPYVKYNMRPYPLVSTDIETWEKDLSYFMGEKDDNFDGYIDPFFRSVAIPLEAAYAAFKKKDDSERFNKAANFTQECFDPAWRTACREWLQRREEKANAKDA